MKTFQISNQAESLPKSLRSAQANPLKLCLRLKKKKAVPPWKILGRQSVELFFSYISKVAFYEAQHWFGHIFLIFFKHKLFKTIKFIRHFSLILAVV